MSDMNDALKAIFAKCKVPEAGKLWKCCEKNQIEEPMDLALFATTVDQLKEHLFEKADLKETVEQVQARKAWALCADSMTAKNNEASAAAHPVDDDAPLSAVEQKTMQEVWYKKYSFNIPGSRMVASGVFNRMARGLNREPRAIQVPLLENVKLMSSIESAHDLKSGLMLSKNGVIDVSVPHTLVRSLRDLEWRIQAVFYSICYIMCAVKDWFPYEDLLVFLDTIHDLIYRRVDGNAPDVGWYNRAYLCSMDFFCNSIKLKGSTLVALTGNIGAWSHYWTHYVPYAGPGRSESGSAPGGPDVSMLPSDLIQRVQQTWSIIKSLQSDRDKANHSKKHARNEDREDDSDDDKAWKKPRGAKKQKKAGKEKGGWSKEAGAKWGGQWKQGKKGKGCGKQ